MTGNRIIASNGISLINKTLGNGFPEKTNTNNPYLWQVLIQMSIVMFHWSGSCLV
jgi:hypothetical protein